MSNRIDFKLDPEALFLHPAADPRLRPVKRPAFFWRERPRARILGFAASADDATNHKIDTFLSHTARHKTFARAVEFNTIPVVLRDAEYRKSYVTAGGKALLNGASGVRLLNRYLWDNAGSTPSPDERLADHFDACQARPYKRIFRPVDTDIAGLPFAIEARNTFNYFHFTTETLCQFCLLDDLGHDRPIFLHHPDGPGKTRGFTRAFLTALFPEFGDRVQFERTPKSYDRVLTGFNLMNAYYQYGDAQVASVDPLIASRTIWAGRRALRRSQAVLQMNAVDASLYRLRERGLRAIEGKDFSHLPKRFWVSRESGHARSRSPVGQDELVEALRPLGFATIAFEKLSPLEQIALMAQAEVMVSSHGAGFTNMLYANPAAHAIEIGTLQSAHFRSGDFWRVASVSGCTYVNVITDAVPLDTLAEPIIFTRDMVPADLSARVISTVVEYLSAVLGGAPRLDGPEAVLRLATTLNGSGAHARTVELFERHPGIEAGNGTLCRVLAEALHETGAFEREIEVLRAAHLAEPGRAFTLVQMVWRAHKAGRADDLEWAFERMRDAFPERLDALLQARPFLRRLTG